MRYPRKNGFFSPAGLGPAFSPKDSTDWEPAAIEKRNPRIRSKNSECELYDDSCAAVRIIEGERGMARAGKYRRLNQEKKYFCFSNRLFLTKEADRSIYRIGF